MTIDGWGLALIGLYVVVRHGYKYLLILKVGGMIKKAKEGLQGGDDTQV